MASKEHPHDSSSNAAPPYLHLTWGSISTTPSLLPDDPSTTAPAEHSWLTHGLTYISNILHSNPTAKEAQLQEHVNELVRRGEGIRCAMWWYGFADVSTKLAFPEITPLGFGKSGGNGGSGGDAHKKFGGEKGVRGERVWLVVSEHVVSKGDLGETEHRAWASEKNKAKDKGAGEEGGKTSPTSGALTLRLLNWARAARSSRGVLELDDEEYGYDEIEPLGKKPNTYLAIVVFRCKKKTMGARNLVYGSFAPKFRVGTRVRECEVVASHPHTHTHFHSTVKSTNENDRVSEKGSGGGAEDMAALCPKRNAMIWEFDEPDLENEGGPRGEETRIKSAAEYFVEEIEAREGEGVVEWVGFFERGGVAVA